ncbi:hypothetical protein [Pseudomonas sp. DY-1]|uniref:hypothetical protein n=1 Tax=Pseudomonas sp. DY-1 TaxID=1755504 RepID=UPI0013C474E9|nr:hypothetical protein [Pseudomonas sp. DY-1]
MERKSSTHGQIDLEKMMQSGHSIAWLSKLSWEIAEVIQCIDKNPAARIFKSMNCAITAWHMSDWIWQFSDPAMKLKLAMCLGDESINDKKKFCLAVQRVCPAIALCRQIGTAVKHVSVDYNRPEVSTQVVRSEDKKYKVKIIDGVNEYVDFDVYTAALEAWARIYVHAELPLWEKVAEMWPNWRST